MMTIGPAVKSGLHLHPPSGNHLHTVKKNYHFSDDIFLWLGGLILGWFGL